MSPNTNYAHYHTLIYTSLDQPADKSGSRTRAPLLTYQTFLWHVSNLRRLLIYLTILGAQFANTVNCTTLRQRRRPRQYTMFTTGSIRTQRRYYRLLFFSAFLVVCWFTFTGTTGGQYMRIFFDFQLQSDHHTDSNTIRVDTIQPLSVWEIDADVYEVQHNNNESTGFKRPKECLLILGLMFFVKMGSWRSILMIPIQISR
ncbi:hypothetical protein K435DRAFT_777407 [Dendrothele bispora CBS 962.96]|uniref:Uncharacterized protein n=1 Tax=Dendrothele bispora (strain CBS 962.96) TaxID=1314807 RepID=A0A4S8M8F0_DENBC|nr:hypothetical protein K435DRAFT_777407 [Dendrothele bispora CBS 962.96]